MTYEAKYSVICTVCALPLLPLVHMRCDMWSKKSSGRRIVGN